MTAKLVLLEGAVHQIPGFHFKYHQLQEGSQATIPKTRTGNVFSHQVELQIWEKINVFTMTLNFKIHFINGLFQKRHALEKIDNTPPLDIAYKFKTLFRQPLPPLDGRNFLCVWIMGFFRTNQYCKVAVKYLHSKITNLLRYN